MLGCRNMHSRATKRGLPMRTKREEHNSAGAADSGNFGAGKGSEGP